MGIVRATMANDGGSGRRDRLAALLDLAAADDAAGFMAALEAAGGEAAELVNGVELWRGRQSNAVAPRTPLMVAASCGSAAVVALLLGLGGAVDVNRRPGVDGATALHCAASGGAPGVVTALLGAGADPSVPVAAGRVPADVVAHPALEALLGRRPGKKEYPADPTLPDMGSAVFSSDAFRMFRFKIQPCARAYAHAWTECPFLHPGENARRRDPRRHAYTAVPCPSARLPGGCPRGDACDFSHGVFETWLHPSQYRTRMCRDGEACVRRICFFAHDQRELRRVPRDASGAGVLPPPPPLPPAAPHWMQQDYSTASRLRNPLNNASPYDAQVDELGERLQQASLRGSQPRLSGVRPSSFHVYSPSAAEEEKAAETALLLARIRRQQGAPPVPRVTQREVFEHERSVPPPIKRQQQPLGSQRVPAPDPSWLNTNIGCPVSNVDWSVGASDQLLWSR